MKYFVIGLGFILSISAAPESRAEDVLRLVTDQAPPYISMKPDGSFEGSFYQRMNCVLTKMDQAYSIGFRPWKRAQAEVENGGADGFFPTSRSDVRDEYAVFSDSLLTAKFNFYFLKDADLKPDDPDFKKKGRVSALWGTLVYQQLTAEGANLGPDAHSFENLFELLDYKRTDAILLSSDIADALLAKQGTKSKYRAQLHSIRPQCIYISKEYLKKHPAFLLTFNKTTKSCS